MRGTGCGRLWWGAGPGAREQHDLPSHPLHTSDVTSQDADSDWLCTAEITRAEAELSLDNTIQCRQEDYKEAEEKSRF